MQVDARDILKLSKDELWGLQDGPMTIRFDDGVLQTTARKTIFSAYLWEFQRRYPKAPLFMRHHISGVDDGAEAQLGARTHLDIMGHALWDAYDAYLASGEEINIEELSKIAYDLTNEVYNDFSYRLEEYVSTISILDFVEVVRNPNVRKANEGVVSTQQSIDDTYRVIENELRNSPSLKNNALAKAARTKLVSMGQVLQTVGPRGFLTDLNSIIFPTAVLTGYTAGITKLYQSMIESRSATKSLMLTKDPLADSQYFNRKLQLLCAILQNLHKGDCGTTVTIPWRVRAGDLKTIDGKYYVDGGKLFRVSRKDKHLIGKVINMRSIFGCAHPDKSGVCATCFGEISRSIPAGTVLGHVSSTVLCEKISQIVLSTKHLDGTSKIDRIQIEEFDRQFIENCEKPNQIKLATALAGKKVKLYVSAEEAKNLTDVMNVKSVKSLSIGRVSELRDVQFGVEGKDGEVISVVSVSDDSRMSSMTHELLEHIKRTDWTVSGTGEYVIDLSGWDATLPMFELPMKHMNMLDFMNSIEAMVKSAAKTTKSKRSLTLADYETPQGALVDFHDLVVKKLEINVAHLEAIVFSTMITSSEKLDYSLPLLGDKAEFGSYADNMAMRSLAAVMAYQNQSALLLDPKSYTVTNRPSHPIDRLLMG